MTSVLLVDTIKNSLDSADTVAFPGGIYAPGHVIQTVIASSTTQASTAVTDLASPVDYLSATITPKSASSVILIRGNISCGGSASSIGVNLFLKAGGSLMTTSELGNDTAGLLDYGFGSTYSTASQNQFSFEVMDSPATTNAFTYTVAFGRYGGSGLAYVGWHNNKSRSSLTLMEIAQ
tara:strand:+ start:12700 stop:13233 length:534 start_codon:yes stop_codon:yes gene_type:complete